MFLNQEVIDGHKWNIELLKHRLFPTMQVPIPPIERPMTLYLFGPFTYRPATGELKSSHGDITVLRHKVSRLLTCLIEHRTRLVTKQELLEALWQHGEYRENSLTQSVKELRKALGDKAQEPLFIKTYSQRGYQWVAPVIRAPEPEEERAEQEVSLSYSKKAESKEIEPEGVTVQRRQPAWRTGLAAVLVLVAIGAGLSWTRAGLEDAELSSLALTQAKPSLVVFPFSNDTGDPTKEWLELGFSDMLASHLQASASLRVTPPAMANGLLLSEQIGWPALPVNIRALLQQRAHDYALIGSVRTHNGLQVLDFQLLYRDGRTQQGSVIYPSLPDATHAIAQQIQLLMQAEHKEQLAQHADLSHGLAGQALAEGINALHLTGPLRAHEFFQAAYLIDKNNPWALAYLAQAQVLLGQWTKATEHLKKLQDMYGGASEQLDAFRLYWQAELAYRQGDNKLALQYLEVLSPLIETRQHIQITADAYRLRAQLAWTTARWDEHNVWLSRAHELYPRSGDLRIEADKLYYLGRPISDGLERDPQQDLVTSAERLQAALNLYSQLGSQPMLAATYFALAQNYRIDLAYRQKALTKAIELYESTGQRAELAESLIYASFFHLQLRDGVAAAAFIDRAEAVIGALGRHRSQHELAFFKAFAFLDQGLDQTHTGLHGPDVEKLKAATLIFEKIIASSTQAGSRATALVLQAWAHLGLGDDDEALSKLSQAQVLSREAAMPTTEGYAVYSAMRVHLARRQYDKVIDLGQAPITTRQQLMFLARAHYDLRQYERAAEVQAQLKTSFPALWSAADEARHQIYRHSKVTNEHVSLPAEMPAHGVYCELEWEI